MSDHFIDDWFEWVSPSELAEKLDVYCNIQNNTPSVKKTTHSREYPSKSYAPKRSSLGGRFYRFNQAGSTSFSNKVDKLKTDDKSEAIVIVLWLRLHSCSSTPNQIAVLKLAINSIWGTACANNGASQSNAGETLYLLLQRDGANFQKTRLSMSLADGHKGKSYSFHRIPYQIPGHNPPVSVPSKFPLYRNIGAPSSPLPFSQSTSAKSNYARDESSSSPSFIGSSPPSSPSSMDIPVPPTFSVSPGTPYRKQVSTCSTLPPKSPLLLSKDRGSSPATSQTINHDVNRHPLRTSARQETSKFMPRTDSPMLFSGNDLLLHLGWPILRILIFLLGSISPQHYVFTKIHRLSL
ncbi:tensin-1 [Trichonephila clavipes]|nr:tensin-1 [Trichonephila clavipes]